MNEAEALFLILAALYVLQCLHWVPEQAFTFRQTFRGRWRPAAAPLPLPALRRKGLLSNPLPPLHAVAICPPRVRAAPVAFSADAIVLPGGATISYEDARQVAAADGRLRFGKHARVRMLSATAAHEWAEALRKLAKQPAEKRAAAIRRLFESLLDSERIAERVAEAHEQAGPVRWQCNLLFFYLFAMAPVLVMMRGLSFAWPYLLAALLLQMWVIAWLFVRTHRRLYPYDPDTRFAATMSIVLSPMAAVRATDVLLHDAVSFFHPVAVAHALSSRDIFEPMAARMLREAFHPAPAEELEFSGPEETAAQPLLSQEIWRTALLEFVRRHVKDADRFLAAPSPQADCRSYCPRCWSQFLLESGQCSDCGLPLRALQAEALSK